MSLPPFLWPSSIREQCAFAGLADSATERLVALAEQVAADPLLRRCAEQLHALTYQRAQESIESIAETLLGEEANALYLLVATDAVRLLRQVHVARGIPAQITQTTATALTNAVRRFGEWNAGKVGIEEWVLRYWFNVVGSGDLYRLGRMEFRLQPFEGNLRVYRQRGTRRVQALAESGVRFAADGYLPFAIQPADETRYGWKQVEEGTGWVSEWIEDEQSVTGTPISSLGYASPDPLCLPLDEWELVLRNGDLTLDMHIPNFAPLTLDLLGDSFRQALDFFPRYHPDRPFAAFTCNSWIFNTQWVDWLPSGSSLLAFQRQGYLFPLSSDGVEGLYFFFGTWAVDLATAPRDTTLRRAVLDHLQAGGKLRSGGFFLLPDEVSQFGQDPYRYSENGK